MLQTLDVAGRTRTARRWIALAFTLVSISWALPALSQDVSLLADDTIDDITLSDGANPQAVTVMRDAYNPNQWYYVPTRPRLVEAIANGARKPVFHLYRYQFNSQDNNELIEGGLLQFSATLSLEPEELNELKQKVLAARPDIDKNSFALSALRMRKATVQLYSPGAAGVFVRTQPDGNGDAPLFTTQDMAFAVDLTKIGTSLYKSLLDGEAGLKLQVDYTYGGLTPPAGFTVTVDYKQVLDYYAKNQIIAAQASYFGLWGASYHNESTEIRQDLENAGALKIDVVEGSGFQKDDIDKYLQPIIKRINDEVLQVMEPPPQIQEPRADPSSKGGFFGSANYSVATKSINQIKQLKETINMRFRMYEERKTSAAANISVGAYPKEVRDTLFSTVQNLNWESTYFRLPAVDVAANSGISTIDLTTALSSGDRAEPERSFTWTASNGEWVDNETNKPSTGTVFALLGDGFTGNVLQNAVFTTTYRFTARGKDESYKIVDSAFTGSRPLTTPTQGLDFLTVDPSALTFSNMAEAGESSSNNAGKKRLLKVTAVIDSTQDRPVSPLTMQSTKANGVVVEAAPVSIFLINPHYVSASSPVSLRVTFHLSDGSTVKWRGNTDDLRRDYPDMNITLVDADWDPTLQ